MQLVTSPLPGPTGPKGPVGEVGQVGPAGLAGPADFAARSLLIVGLALALLLVCGAAARGEVRRMEAVGSEPVYLDARALRAPRDAAVQQALLEAVSRVAAEFVSDQELANSATRAPDETGPAGDFDLPGSQQPVGSTLGGDPAVGPGFDPSLPPGFGLFEPAFDPLLEAPSEPDPPEPPPDYAKIFGRNLVQYTVNYRILEDRGERPALFAADPQVKSEYVVVVEVHVDADRVKHRLEEIGLLVSSDPVTETRRILLEARGLRVYPAYQALQAILLEKIGAPRVVALEFTQDQVTLGVEYASGGPAELLDALYASSPRGFTITPVLSDEHRLTISVDWVPPGPEQVEPPGFDEYEDLEGHDGWPPLEFDLELEPEDADPPPPPPVLGGDPAPAVNPRWGEAPQRTENPHRVDTGSRNRY